MAGEQTIDQLNIEINTEAKQSSSGMDKLIASIEKLKTMTGGGVGELTGIAASLATLTKNLASMKGQSGSVTSLASSINKLNDVKTNNIASSIKTLTDSLKMLGGLDPTLKTMIADLGSLARSGGGNVSENALSLQAAAAKAQATIDKSALTSAKAQEGLKAIADKNAQIEETARAAAQQEQQLTDSINAAIQQHIQQQGSAGAFSNAAADLGAVMPDYTEEAPVLTQAALNSTGSSYHIQESIDSLKTAVGEVGGAASTAMSEVSSGSSRAASFVDKLRDSLKSAKDKLSSMGASSNSFFSMGRLYGWYFILRQIANTFGGWINNINSYIENMNLFSVAMGKSAQSGTQLAQSLQKVLGIDSGEAMRYMGVFQELGSSFGIANKQAVTMSENLTQLGYDLASFYNISTSTSFDKLESVYTGQSRAARSLGIDITNARLQQELYNLGINEKVNDLTQADKAELRYIAIMKQTANAQGDMARTIQTPANALRVLQAQLSITGRAIGSIFIPALEEILPVATAVIEVIGDLASELASLVGFKMPKIDYSSLKNISTDADDASTAVSGIGDSATKSKKQLDNLISGFDELNILQTNSDDDSTATGASGTPGNILSGIDLPSYDALKNSISNQIDALKNQIKQSLADITAIVSGELLAVGAILVLTGANIPLGLGLMALGAVGLAADIAANWDSMTTPLLNTLTTITGAVGGFLLALGAIMALSGANVPLGVGFIVAGAVSLATSVGIDWNSQKTQLSTALSGITGVISGALLAIGGMLTFTGANVPLGLGLMAIGATGLAASVSLNWNGINKQTKDTLSTITATVGGSMLAVGAILTFSGASPALGISAMAVGTSTLAETVAVNWDSMDSQLKKTLTTITASVGGFSLALGAVLAFSGANIPLGIGLIAAGAASLATTATLDWNAAQAKTSNATTTITDIVSGALLAVGALLTFSGANVPLGIGIMAAGAVGLASTLSLDWNKMGGNINDTLSKINIAVGASSLAIGAAFALSGANLPLGIALMVAGAAGLIAAAKLNWDTMPNQTKSTLTKLTLIVGTSLLALGAVLTFTGVAAPLGIGMMIAGATGLAASVALNWDSIKDKIKTTLADITLAASLASTAIGLLLCLTGAGIPLGIGLILAGVAGTAAASVISGKPLEDLVQGIIDSIVEKFDNGIDQITEKYKEAAKGLGGIGFSGGGGGAGGSGGGGVRWNASGGVYSSTTLIGVGEYPSAQSNPEVVAPQSIIRETVDESNDNVVAAIYAMAQQIVQAVQEKDTSVNLDGKVIAKSTNKVNASRGYNLGPQST